MFDDRDDPDHPDNLAGIVVGKVVVIPRNGNFDPG